MFGNREYDIRSAVALDNFKKTVNKKKEENNGGSKTFFNKWSAFNELVNKTQCDESKTCDFKSKIEDIDLVNISSDFNEKMDIVLETNSTLNKCESQAENFEAIAEELLEEFKSDSDSNVSFLENLLFNKTGFTRICNLILFTIPASTVLNLCRAFCRLNKLQIEEHCKEFYSCFLLPTILSRDSSKEIECSVFECLEKADYTAVCSLVMLPMLMKGTISCLLNVSFVTKISLVQKQFLLKEYLKNYTAQFSWSFPILLFLYTAIEAGNDDSVDDLMADYLLIGSITYKKDINFAKILHAVAVNVRRKDVSANYGDLLIKLKKTAQENETAFKNKCLSILTEM